MLQEQRERTQADTHAELLLRYLTIMPVHTPRTTWPTARTHHALRGPTTVHSVVCARRSHSQCRVFTFHHSSQSARSCAYSSASVLPPCSRAASTCARGGRRTRGRARRPCRAQTPTRFVAASCARRVAVPCSSSVAPCRGRLSRRQALRSRSDTLVVHVRAVGAARQVQDDTRWRCAWRTASEKSAQSRAAGPEPSKREQGISGPRLASLRCSWVRASVI